MEQELNQDIQQDNPDETAAVLAFATKLSEQLLPKAPPESIQPQKTGATSVPNQESEETPVQEEKAPEMDLEANNKEMEKTMDSKLDELRKEMKKTIKEEISGIKEDIEEALKEDE
mgnify:CR=1 FL=1